jgi:hypothetical protein
MTALELEPLWQGSATGTVVVVVFFHIFTPCHSDFQDVIIKEEQNLYQEVIDLQQLAQGFNLTAAVNNN